MCIILHFVYLCTNFLNFNQKLLILDLIVNPPTTFLGLNFLRVLLHVQNKINAKKFITLALKVAILQYGVWF